MDFLLNIPISKQDFMALVPTMLPEEQARLNGLTARNPLTLLPFTFNHQEVDDRFMASLNTPGIHDPNNRRRRR